MMREIAALPVTSAEYVRQSGGCEVFAHAYIACGKRNRPAYAAGFHSALE
jgi:hypothetical protein